MPDLVTRLVRQYDLTRVLEVGAGANPTLTSSLVNQLSIDYSINDVSEEELNKFISPFRKEPFNFCDPDFNHDKKYDFIFSRMVAEHVKNGEIFYRNIYNSLEEGGVTAHCFPTLYAFPFILNSILSGGFSEQLLDFFHPRGNKYKQGKFKAYYSWARGPSQSSKNRFTSLGFEILEYHGYFGHVYYRKHLKPLHWLEMVKTALLLRIPIPQLTSYATIVLRKGNRL
jgi:hypothetical protein